MPKTMSITQRRSLVRPLLQLAATAGRAIVSHYHAPGADQYHHKGDDTPLTAADLEADAILTAGLRQIAPEIPVLSEESPPGARDEQRRWTRYWLVDPLDGTREFINRTGQFTVNIALIEYQRPVLGVLFVPLEQTGFVGIPGAGAARYTPAAGSRWRSSAIQCRALASGQPLALLASHRHRSARLKALLAWLDTHWAGYERFDSSSALKFTDLAQGMGDFYPRFSTCCEWDTAAGQALVEAAGGAVLGMDGQPLRYNTRQSLYSPHFYAVADPEHALWADLIAAQLG